MKRFLGILLSLLMVFALIPAFTIQAAAKEDSYTRADAAVFLAEKFALADIHASSIEGYETTPKNLGYTASSDAIGSANVVAAAKDCVGRDDAPKIEAVINAQLMDLAADGLSFNPDAPITVREMATAVAKGMYGADLSIDHLDKLIGAGLIDAGGVTDDAITAAQVDALFGFLDDITVVAVFATSDIHGNYLPYKSSDKNFTIGSVARIKTVMNEVEAMVGADNVIYVDGGDSPYNTTFSNVTLGDSSVACLNALGLDATVLGNHDYDYSFENLLRLRDEADYLMLSANTKFKEGMNYEGESDHPFPAYTTIEAGGIKFGIFGVTDDQSAGTTLYTNTTDIEWDDDLTTAATVIDTLKTTEACDVVIALSHLHSKNTQLVTDNTDIDISIGGGNDIAGRPTIINDDQYLINPSKHGEALNQINVVIYNGAMTGVVYSQIFLTEAYEEDATVKGIVDDYSADVEAEMNVVIGYSAQNLPWSTQLVRGQNCPLANLVADAMRDFFATDTFTPDICIVNGGGMRAAIPEGGVTIKNCSAVVPFDNDMMLVSTHGSTVVKALENGVSALPGLNGKFPQVSGITYSVDLTAEAGHRVHDVKMADGTPIDPEAVYTVVINSFLAGGGDGYTMFNVLNPAVTMATDVTVLTHPNKTYMRDALQAYFEKSTAENPVTVDVNEVRILIKDTLTFAYYETTDMHGRTTELDVSTAKNDANSMVRVSSILTAEKAAYGANTLIVDNGDSYQGNLLAQYAATMNNTVENPMTTALKDIGYDVFVLGNHEFNYLPTVRDTQMNLLEAAGIPVLAANVTLVEDGTNLAGEAVAAGSTFYTPYTIKEFTNAYGQTARVAVIGFENASCDSWDSSQNFPNLRFYSADNPTRAFENEINKWVSYVKANEDVDIIIVSAHTGNGRNDEASTSSESQGLHGAANASGVALYSFGHDHSAGITTVTDKEGKTIPVINGGGSTIAKAEFVVSFDDDGNVTNYAITTSALPIGDGEVDTVLQAKLQPWYDAAREWAGQARGTFSGGWDNEDIKAESTDKSNNDMVTGQTHLMDLIHKAQIWASWQSLDSKGIEGATVSIASAVFGYTKPSNYISFVPSDGDTVSLLDVSRLYRYSNNLLVAVDMSGEQLWSWMNAVADMYDYNAATGAITLNSSIYGVDTFYGVDYTMDLTRAKGHRLVMATYNGEDLLTYGGTIRVTLNSYRIGGGFGFYEATGLTGDDCCWTASAYLGDQHAPVPTLICEYIEYMGTVTPYDEPYAGTASEWHLTAGYLLGDANVDASVTAADAACVLRMTVKLEDETYIKHINGDVSGDDMIEANDAAYILRWLVKIDKQFPVEAASNVEIRLLATSDVHGQVYPTNYTAGFAKSGQYNRSLAHVATYVNTAREENDNVLLVDGGDLIQGTPLTYYYAFYKQDVDDPSMKALRSIGYDMFVVGNHEFNYGLSILNRQLDYLTSADTEGESSVSVCVANYLDAATNNADSKDWATWKGYAPYIIKNYDGVRVAILGLGNPNIANWDIPANWEGIYFAGLEETYLHYEAELKQKADIIVVVSHNGANDSDAANGDSMAALIAATDSIDVAICGHEHYNGVRVLQNSAGEDVPVMGPSTKAVAVADALLNYNRATGKLTINASIANVSKLTANADFISTMQSYETATWNDYMLQPIGTASADFTASNLGTAPSAFMDLINKVQLWGAYDRTGLNTPDNANDDTIAQLSISAPLTSGTNANLIPQGQIVLGDMFALYRYENWFYQITMTGKEIRTWLEFAATKISVSDEGVPSVSAGNLTYYDVIYGDGFSYDIYYQMPEGSRVQNMTYNGEAVTDEQVFTIVVNNYRYNGGGNYVAYLNANGCEFVANDQNRVIYSTQFNMIQGEDKGQARNLLADYISLMGTIDPTITSTWKLVAGQYGE